MASRGPDWTVLFVRTAATIALVSLGLGCSTERRYKTLSFFFDGVPAPTAPSETATPAGAAPEAAEAGALPQRSTVTLVQHPPYEEGACDVCHTFQLDTPAEAGGLPAGMPRFSAVGGNGSSLTMPLEELCVMCHDEFSPDTAQQDGLWLHGPVGAGACTFCHDQHKERNPKLLHAARPRDLCLRCHEAAALAANEDHPPVENEECTDCHDPHRGDSRFLL